MPDFLNLETKRIDASHLASLHAAASDIEKIREATAGPEGAGRTPEARAEIKEQLDALEFLFRVSFLCLAVNFTVDAAGRRGMATAIERARKSPLLLTPKQQDFLGETQRSLSEPLSDEAWETGRTGFGAAVLKPLKSVARQMASDWNGWGTVASTGGRRSLSPTVRKKQQEQGKFEKPRGRDEQSFEYVTWHKGPKTAEAAKAAESTESSEPGNPFAGLHGLFSNREHLWELGLRSRYAAGGLGGLGVLGCCLSPREFLAAYREM